MSKHVLYNKYYKSDIFNSENINPIEKPSKKYYPTTFQRTNSDIFNIHYIIVKVKVIFFLQKNQLKEKIIIAQIIEIYQIAQLYFLIVKKEKNQLKKI